MVASVGPYRFSSTDPDAASCQTWAVAAGNASPQNRLQRSDGRLSGTNTPLRCCNTATEGTENQTVMPLSRTKSNGFIRSKASMGTRQPPLPQLMNRSKTDRSKVWSKVLVNRSSAAKPYRSVLAARKEAALACEICTPLGRPVVPEVKSRYAPSSGATSTGSASGTQVSTSARVRTRAPTGKPAGTSSVSGSTTAGAPARPSRSAPSCLTEPASASTTSIPARSRSSRLRAAGYFLFRGTTVAPAYRPARKPA